MTGHISTSGSSSGKAHFSCWAKAYIVVDQFFGKEWCWPSAADMSLHFRIVVYMVAISTGFASVIGEYVTPERGYGTIHTKVGFSD